MTTLQEIFYSQDPSDMFFNDERVVKAYERSFTPNRNYDEDDAFEEFVRNLSEDFGKEFGTVIARDFLERV